MTSAHARRLILIAVTSIAASGCQLTFDLDDYPYTPTLIGDDADVDPDPDVGPDASDAPDAPDVPLICVPNTVTCLDEDTRQLCDASGTTQTAERCASNAKCEAESGECVVRVGPRLLFSEFLMDSSFTVDGSKEVAEFFEFVNIGDENARVSRVSITFSDPENAGFADAWGNLPPGIDLTPDAFYLVHLGDTPNSDFENDIPSTRRHDTSVGNNLSNSSFRRADLVYDGEVHDTIYWNSGDMRLCSSGGDVLSCPPEDVVIISGSEGSSFFLRDSFRSVEDSKKTDAWCLSAKVYVNGLNGYPGVRNPDDCP